MRLFIFIYCWALLTSVLFAAGPITTGTLLQEMADLDSLARWPNPAFRTVQFSSYDRRSTAAEAPGWFANADGFGREPLPGFVKVLREPRSEQPGIYLLAEVTGPGAIVRGWSAGMNGVLRVILDPEETGKKLIWEGKAYEFLARRSSHYLKSAGIMLDAGDAFVQQDADYLPIPFQRGLRVTWEGSLNELHFYHLQVRTYPASSLVRTFDPKADLREFEAELRATATSLTAPATAGGDAAPAMKAQIEPGTSWAWSPERGGPAALREWKVRLKCEHMDQALRGCLLRIAFDGSQRPQVEAPLGDFFGSGPGINPFSSLPLSVAPDGTLACRFVMPFEKTLRLEIVNFTGRSVGLEGSARISDWAWDERSMYFRAKWRADHDLLGKPAAMDLPYLLIEGQGVFVGCAAMIMNPSGVPTAGGNWWGEGDEKFLVDGERTPSTFGTGSEDYFNYSWSRPDLFDHPYCGQPLDSGPDTSGYVSNYRYQILDAIPFERSFAAYMELWTHGQVPGMSYARIVYHYARPGAWDDHRSLAPADLKVVPLPLRALQAAGGAAGAKFYLPEQFAAKATGGVLETRSLPLATQLKVLHWQAEKGDRLKLSINVEKAGNVELHPVVVHSPTGAAVRFLLNGTPLSSGETSQIANLKTPHTTRVLNLNLPACELAAGSHELAVECVEPGSFGLDYLWLKAK